MKLLFKPIGILSGRLAGVTARRLTDRLWNVIDDGKPPRPEQRAAAWPKLAAGLAVEGAVFAVVGGLADHAARRWFANVTGSWPGDEESQPG